MYSKTIYGLNEFRVVRGRSIFGEGSGLACKYFTRV